MIPDLIRRNRDGFTAELMGRWAGHSFPESPRAPVFVMGFYRSGTTLSQEVLDAHPDVFVADEAGLLWAMQQALNRMDPSPASMPEKLARLDHEGVAKLRAAYWAAARGRYGSQIDTPVFVDKYTLNTVDVGLINTVFPDAKVLFVMRDPRDVCLSCVMQLMVPTPSTRHLLTLPETAALYAQVVNWWIAAKEMLTLQVLEFRYEDAVDSFDATFKPIFEFLGLAWDPEVVNFHKRAAGKFIASPSRNQVAQPLYSTSVARWRRYERDVGTVSEVLAPFIEHFRYESA